MHRASEHKQRGDWPKSESVGQLILDYDARHRRRLRLTTDKGEDVLLDLPKAVAMADGDGLRLDDGRWLRVTAAAEQLAEIRCRNAHELARIAWHLGNRHLPAEIGDGIIHIRPDHVIESMLAGLGAQVSHVDAPFQPEGGAYGGHSHDSGHHNHSHSHEQGHHHHHETDGHHAAHHHHHD